MRITAINNKTGEVFGFSTDWMFDSRYANFILEKKEDWEFIEQKKCQNCKNEVSGSDVLKVCLNCRDEA